MTFTQEKETILEEDSFADYRSKEGLNQSSFKDFLPETGGCPAKFHYNALHPQEKNTDAMAFGRLVHTAVLEPELVADEYTVFSKAIEDNLLFQAQARGSKAKTLRKNAPEYIEWLEKNAGKEIVTEDNMAESRKLSQAISKHPIYERIESSRREVSVFATYEASEGPIRIKGRIDALDVDGRQIIDLKTTRAGGAEPRAFGQTAWNFGYLFQAGWYNLLCRLAGIRIDNFRILAVETSEPYLHAVYDMPSQALRWGETEAELALDRLSLCMKTGEWEGYADDYLSVPGWASRIIEEDLECAGPLPDPF